MIAIASDLRIGAPLNGVPEHWGDWTERNGARNAERNGVQSFERKRKRNATK